MRDRTETYDGLGRDTQDEVSGGVLPLLPTPGGCGSGLRRRTRSSARAATCAWACVTGSMSRASGSTYQQLLDDYLASKQFKPAFEVLAKIPADSVTLSFARFLHA